MKSLKIVLSVMICMSLFITPVMAGKEASINDVIDKYQYSMNVEWDQKDQEFARKAETELMESLNALEVSGVSAAVIQKHLEENVLKGTSQKGYQRFISALKAQKVSTEEQTQKTIEFMDKHAVQGTNFYGEGAIVRSSKFKFVVTIVVVVIVTHWLLKKGHDHHDHDHDHEYDH